jgi:hypothetical protein
VSGSDVTLILSRLDSIDQRLNRIEDMQGYAALAVLNLLVAMKDDEKVRSQMRATVSDIKTDYERQINEWMKKQAA